MTNEDFLKLINRTGKRNMIVSVFFILFGLGMLVLAAAGIDKTASSGTRIFVYIFGGFCALLGVLVMVKSAQSRAQIKNGSHPLANAILKNDQRFVLWYYEHIITTENIKQTAAHQVWIYDSRNKSTIISVKRGHVEAVFQYLRSKFPNALVGYSEENKKRYKEMVS